MQIRRPSLRCVLPAVLIACAAALPAVAEQAGTRQSEPRQSGTAAGQKAGDGGAAKDVRPAGIWYGVAEARPKQKGALRLATYNAENLFDNFDDPELSGQYDDKKEQTSEARLKALAEMIRELDADVLCLEEIESERALAWFRDKYLKGMGYDHVASLDAGYNRGVEQSVLSRVPIASARVYTGDERVISDMAPRCTPESAGRLEGEWSKPNQTSPSEKFQRSPLRVDLKTDDGYELTVFVCHFKAGGRDFAQQREFEALQVEEFVSDEMKRNPDANIAVVGDFNATPGDMATKALRMSPLGLVSAYDWRFDKKADKDVYTTHASGRAIDYIVMTPGLAADCVDGSYFVLGTLHAASDWDWRKADEIPPPPGYASDHCPVAIDLVTKPDRPAAAFTKEKPKFEEKKPAVAAPKGLRPLEGGAKAPAADVALATRLQAAGWVYMMPMPKSKTAQWGNDNAETTWFPGYWANAANGATSVAQPEQANGFKGDGAKKPGWRKGGSPKAPSFVEWLCSTEGGIAPK